MYWISADEAGDDRDRAAVCDSQPLSEHHEARCTELGHSHDVPAYGASHDGWHEYRCRLGRKNQHAGHGEFLLVAAVTEDPALPS